MKKFNNNHGFTMIEMIFGITFLAAAMVTTQMTLNSINDINNMNAKKQQEVIASVSNFETYVDSVYTYADVVALASPSITTLNYVPCYSYFNTLTTDDPADTTQYQYYYNPGLVLDSTDPTYKVFTRTVYTFVESGTGETSPYYFVIHE